MCQRVQIEFPNSSTLCETVGELTALIGPKVIMLSGYSEPVGDGYCLCPVDLEKTARAAGYGLVHAGGTAQDPLLPGDVIFRPIPDTPAQRDTNQRRRPIAGSTIQRRARPSAA